MDERVVRSSSRRILSSHAAEQALETPMAGAVTDEVAMTLASLHMDSGYGRPLAELATTGKVPLEALLDAIRVQLGETWFGDRESKELMALALWAMTHQSVS